MDERSSRAPFQNPLPVKWFIPLFYRGTFHWQVKDFLVYYHSYCQVILLQNYKTVICLENKFYFFTNISLPVACFACYIKIKLYIWKFAFRVTSDKISMIWAVKHSYKNLAQSIIVIIICKVLLYLIFWLTKLSQPQLRCIWSLLVSTGFIEIFFYSKLMYCPFLFVCVCVLINIKPSKLLVLI